MRIYKYELVADRGTSFVMMPIGARAISAGEQSGRLYVWAEACLSEPLEQRRFLVQPTGYIDLPPMPLKFIDTVQMQDGLVWHVYEVMIAPRVEILCEAVEEAIVA